MLRVVALPSMAAGLLALSCAPTERVESASPESASAGPSTLTARAHTQAGRATSTRIEKVVTRPGGDPDRARLALLPAQGRLAVEKAKLPVLAPARSGLLGAAVLVARPGWWSLSMRHDGLTVVVTSSRLAHRYEGLVDPKKAGPDGRVRGPRVVRGADAWVTRNEGVPSVSWVENGASMALEIECATPADERCTQDDELLSLAASLAWIGGGP